MVSTSDYPCILQQLSKLPTELTRGFENIGIALVVELACMIDPCSNVATTLHLINPPLRASAAEGYCSRSVCVCPSVRLPPFFSVTAATLSVKRGHIIK